MRSVEVTAGARVDRVAIEHRGVIVETTRKSVTSVVPGHAGVGERASVDVAEAAGGEEEGVVGGALGFYQVARRAGTVPMPVIGSSCGGDHAGAPVDVSPFSMGGNAPTIRTRVVRSVFYGI